MKQFSEITAFSKRKLDAEVADSLGARFENGRFVFEYKDHDAVTFRKIRTPDKRFWVEPKGAPLHLWNIDSLRGLGSRPRSPLVITEGEMDTIAVYQTCRDVFVVSVPNGANGHKSDGAIYPGSDSGFRYLWGRDGKLLPEIDQFDKIILATDDDEKGILLRDELAIRIGESRCWHAIYPEGCKDANAILEKYGAETLARVMQKAKPMRPGFLVKPSEMPSRGTLKTYSTGWAELDPHLMLARPELLVVTGIPGHGKTAWIRSLTFRLAKAHQWRIAFLTPEDPHERLMRDMRRFAKAHFGHESVGWQRDWIDNHFRISHPPIDERISLPFVFDEMESAALQHDCQMFVVDPWNTISHARGNRPETEYIEDAIEDVKRKGRRLSLCNAIVAHPRKIKSGQKPDLYTINGSAHWFNKPDHGVIIYRSTPDDTFIQAIIAKSKDHETMGRPGTVWMTYKPDEADYFVNSGR